MNVSKVAEGLKLEGIKKIKKSSDEDKVDFELLLSQLMITTSDIKDGVSNSLDEAVGEGLNGDVIINKENINVAFSHNEDILLKSSLNETVSRELLIPEESNLEKQLVKNPIKNNKSVEVKKGLEELHKLEKKIRVTDILKTRDIQGTNNSSSIEDGVIDKISNLTNNSLKKAVTGEEIKDTLTEISFSNLKGNNNIKLNVDSNINNTLKDSKLHDEDPSLQGFEINHKDGKEKSELSTILGNGQTFDTNSDVINNSNTKELQGNLKLHNSEEINNNIISEVRDLKEGEKSILKMVLKPKELGEVKIELELKNGLIKGQIIVENSEVRSIFEKQMEGLKLQLKSRDVNIENLDVNVNQDFNNQEDQRSFNHHGNRRKFYNYGDRDLKSKENISFSNSPIYDEKSKDSSLNLLA